MRDITINADLGESIGIHSFGNDEQLISIVDTVNVACGMHAGDPGTMDHVAGLAAEAGVSVGAHPGLPDITGFGRREMALTASEVRDLVRYQVGALTAFLDAHGLRLDHIKPHGALFAMTARDEALADSVCEVAAQYGVAVFGLSGTAHESAAHRAGVSFVSEYYADLDYDDDGMVLVSRRAAPLDITQTATRVRRAVVDGVLATASGRDRPVRVDSICIHSDRPDAVQVARHVRAELTRIRTESAPNT